MQKFLGGCWCDPSQRCDNRPLRCIAPRCLLLTPLVRVHTNNLLGILHCSLSNYKSTIAAILRTFLVTFNLSLCVLLELVKSKFSLCSFQVRGDGECWCSSVRRALNPSNPEANTAAPGSGHNWLPTWWGEGNSF